MKITFDPNKREITMNDHGIDFADAALVFSGARLIFKMTGKTTAKRGSSRPAICEAG
jgi:uncharacterized DUF497 family protein